MYQVFSACRIQCSHSGTVMNTTRIAPIFCPETHRRFERQWQNRVESYFNDKAEMRCRNSLQALLSLTGALLQPRCSAPRRMDAWTMCTYVCIYIYIYIYIHTHVYIYIYT